MLRAAVDFGPFGRYIHCLVATTTLGLMRLLVESSLVGS